MITRLEGIFLRKVIERLDPAALLLLEMLSVYRTTFTIDVIKGSVSRGVQPEIAKEVLTSRFILGRRGSQYSLNPIARQLSLTGLTKEPRRRRTAHNLAADYYTKRINPANERARAKAGADFIEARYHLLQADRETEFQHLAGDYRRLLLNNYRNLDDIPSHPVAAAQLLATLMVVLSDVDGGYSRLRVILAHLLVERGRPDDDRLAYRQVSIATRESRDRGSWLLRLRLAAKLDTPRSILSFADQVIERLEPENAVVVVVGSAEILAARGENQLALEAVNHAIPVLPISHRQRLYSAAAYLLCRNGRQSEAIKLLTEGYQEIGPKAANSWRLFEQAAFIAFAKGDKRQVGEIKELITLYGINEDQPVLCDVLSLQIDGDYLRAARLAEMHTAYSAVAAQGAFCWLAEGQSDRAAKILDQTRLQPNRAARWLQGAVAASHGAWDVYGEAMSRASSQKFSEDERVAPDLWVRVWEETPSWIGVFPAFYFPRLPASLTGLSVDLQASHNGPSAITIFRDHNFSLLDTYRHLRSGGRTEEKEKMADLPKTVNYNIYGATGAIGENASADRTQIQNVVLAEGATNAQLIDQLRQLLADLQEEESPESQSAAGAIEVAITAAQQRDDKKLIASLRRAGQWALGRAVEIGTTIAATALQRAMGLPPG